MQTKDPNVQKIPTASDQAVVIRSQAIRSNADGLVCLNDLWMLMGSDKNRRPYKWRRSAVAKRLVAALAVRIGRNSPKSSEADLIDAKRGTKGLTYAHVVLALAYAEYLDAGLAVEVREVFLRYRAGDATLADEVLQRAAPEGNEWAAIRALGRSQRRRYTDCLQDHGVQGKDYGICTDSGYRGLFGKSAKDLRVEKGLGKSASLRDAMTADELTFVMATETLARERITEEQSEGGEECRVATLRSALNLRKALEIDRADRKGRNVAANENRRPDTAA